MTWWVTADVLRGPRVLLLFFFTCGPGGGIGAGGEGIQEAALPLWLRHHGHSSRLFFRLLCWLVLDGSLAPFEMSYDVIIAGFEGDWYDSALIYREWALTSASWCQQGNLTARAAAADSAYPTWLFRTPLWALTPAPPPMLSVNDSW